MGLLGFSGKHLKKTLSKGNLFSAISTAIAQRILSRSRQKWEQARAESEAALLSQISAYEVGRGAGKLLKGWLRFQHPRLNLAQAEGALLPLLTAMDAEDHLPQEQALSRFIVSKTLFSIEGFKLTHCRYESYQQAALERLRKNPEQRTLTRSEVFQGRVFLPEDIIATTHRMLLLLDNGRMADYLQPFLETGPLNDDADHMARLIAMTFQADDDTLGTAINTWFQSYCDFKIDESHQQELWVNTSVNAVSGGLPAQVGWDLLGRAGKHFFSSNPKR
ncbi:hypothetical protein [Vampirovibrio chlorellavorus]|uniref:hypothetical protein n=1 Tax=Vampirovibrio chlorellavorus TaxID=758823 RepID=UPI0026F0C40A|nr:hypothetical protein [Vampirovibrio chlorellavorus]